MASKGVRDFATLFDVVDLSMGGRNDMVLIFFQVLECVVWSCKEKFSAFNVTGIPRNLKPSSVLVYLSWNTHRTGA